MPRTRDSRPRILVAGLGNLLLQDDGFGVHAVRAIQKNLPRGVKVVEVGTAVLDALHLFKWADKILAFDAMQAGGHPGAIYGFEVKDVDEKGVEVSLHEMGLVAAMRFLNGPNPEIAILGVEPKTIDYGMDLTEPVQAALPRTLSAAREIVESWLAGRSTPVRDMLARMAETSAGSPATV